MVAPAYQVVLSGYYGYRNSGDEAVLQSILIALDRWSRELGVQIVPVVLSGDPAWTTAAYGVRAVPRMSLGEVRRAIAESDALISGGGSLLQDVTGAKSIPYYLGVIKLAQMLGKPSFVYAQGIGPVNRKWFYPMIRSVFRRCKLISVRDEQSRALLLSMGLRAEDVQVVPDPVMGLKLPGEEDGGGLSRVLPSEETLPCIGVSVRFWEKDRRELDAIADGLRQACQSRPLHIRFLPFHVPSDIEASRYCMERLGEVPMASGGSVSIAEPDDRPQSMLREVGECSLLLGMRLHSLIYAAGRRVPVIGISYDPKIDHFLSRLDVKPVGTTESLDADLLGEEVLRLLEHGTEWLVEREERIAALVREAEAPARYIVDYFRRKG
ncbi:polysaccharide pyruvyl transferase CsaB [Paenibacillus glufosinatiresistens]|uniref:polysaccharide pyruvyl transferase CsaB n=1 Tax=Paenibacillus glufosinatiresistens TaxID=3070657 RepID=UPI00286D811A|nr:polysaccharide pyruvyl transferase CsaB [Paenibacillus sp. YX.27]